MDPEVLVGVRAVEAALDREGQGDLLRDAVEREGPDRLPLPARLPDPAALEADLGVLRGVEEGRRPEFPVPGVVAGVDARHLDDRDDPGLRQVPGLPGVDLDVVAHELSGDLRNQHHRDGELDVGGPGIDGVVGGACDGGHAARDERGRERYERGAQDGGESSPRGPHRAGSTGNPCFRRNSRIVAQIRSFSADVKSPCLPPAIVSS